MELLLLIISRAAQIILLPILLIWGCVRAIYKREFMQWSKAMAIGIDRFGNCMGKYAFNDLLGEEFGNSKETISSRLGKCDEAKKLKRIGPYCVKVLELTEREHCKNSIDLII